MYLIQSTIYDDHRTYVFSLTNIQTYSLTPCFQTSSLGTQCHDCENHNVDFHLCDNHLKLYTVLNNDWSMKYAKHLKQHGLIIKFKNLYICVAHRFTLLKILTFTCHITLLLFYKTSGDSSSFSSDTVQNICFPEYILKHWQNSSVVISYYNTLKVLV
jgi:hypothetical protein